MLCRGSGRCVVGASALLAAKCAKAGARADLRVVAAGVGAFFVDRATAGLRIQIDAVVISAPCQRENAVLEVEMFDGADFQQPFGNLFCGLTGFKFIYHAHAHQIWQSDFNRHGAAGTRAVVAQSGAVLQPGSQAIQFGQVDEEFLHGVGQGIGRLLILPVRAMPGQYGLGFPAARLSIVNNKGCQMVWVGSQCTQRFSSSVVFARLCTLLHLRYFSLSFPPS